MLPQEAIDAAPQEYRDAPIFTPYRLVLERADGTAYVDKVFPDKLAFTNRWWSRYYTPHRCYRLDYHVKVSHGGVGGWKLIIDLPPTRKEAG